MFGFLHGPWPNRLYRQIYASCCSSLRDRFGYRSLPFVSYEAIFARAIATDLGLLPTPDDDAATCCRARRSVSPFRSSDSATLQAADRFTTSFAMLLAEVKLRDDVADSRSMVAGVGRFLLRKPIGSACEFFETQQPDFGTRLKSIFEKHARMEAIERAVPLERYCGPTGNAFALVYGILPRAISQACGGHVDSAMVDYFRTCGKLVGEALIAFDCAVDFEADRRRGHFNPLASSAEIRSAFEFSQRRLVELGWVLNESPYREQPRSHVARAIVRHRIDTLVERKLRIALAPRSGRGSRPASTISRGSVSRRSAFPLFFSPRPRRGVCDCDCACDGCGSLFGNLFDCCQGPNLFCGDCCCDAFCSSDRSTVKQPGDPKVGAMGNPSGGETAREQFAEVVVALSPYGTVRLIGSADSVGDAADGGQSAGEVPAKSDVGVIEAGERVRVIRKDSFGLLVRPWRENASDDDEPSET